MKTATFEPPRRTLTERSTLIHFDWLRLGFDGTRLVVIFDASAFAKASARHEGAQGGRNWSESLRTAPNFCTFPGNKHKGQDFFNRGIRVNTRKKKEDKNLCLFLPLVFVRVFTRIPRLKSSSFPVFVKKPVNRR
jgi:hypothetical protein